jgi:hypothetical protein
MSIRVVLEPSFEVYVNKARMQPLATQKAEELLQFLILHRGTRFTRQILQERFWSRSEPEQAQISLRQAIHSINKAFGDQSPIVSKRSEIYCRASDVYMSHPHTPELVGGEPVDPLQSLLVSFRREPLDQSLRKFVAASQEPSHDRLTNFSIRFMLAYAYNETGFEKLALNTAKQLLVDAESKPEIVIAKHALGGILFHAGHFQQGISQLWDAARLAEDDAVTRMHILNNIAIGSYEANQNEDLEYASALARQQKNSDLTLMSQHTFVLDYVSALEKIRDREPHVAAAHLEELVHQTSNSSHRLNAYLLEALALAKYRCQQPDSALKFLNQARTIRQTYRMQPSTVETRRLRQLRQQITQLREQIRA